MILQGETLRKTEMHRILEIFAQNASSEIGVQYIHRLQPAKDIPELLRRHERLRDMLKFRSKYSDRFSFQGLAPVAVLLEESRSSSFLGGTDLYKICRLMITAQKLRSLFDQLKDEYPSLWNLSRKIRDFSKEIEAFSVINADGTLLDSASPLLSELRYESNSVKGKIRSLANTFFSDSRWSIYFQDRNLHIRNGRYVLALRLEAASGFRGILQDRSATGNTVYMEHEDMIGPNNRLSQLKSDERDEIERVLRYLTGKVNMRRGALYEAELTVASFDFLVAVVELLDRKAWNLPIISQRQGFRLKKAWHPLLRVEPVPLDIHCGGTFTVLVITGPNTGGKTVALKTVALCIILAWMGLPVPAAETSEVGLFSSVYFDIGDEQSVEQNLSTFSAHIVKTIEMLRHSERNSLLLIDEMGSGTDPQEGAALGIAILQVLREKGIITIATTHHNPIKRFALSSPGIETASMEFDEKTLQPTFRLIMGAPGKSNALIIAERLGMPLEVIQLARKAMEDEGAFTSRMIDELHDKQLEVQKGSEQNMLLFKELQEKEKSFSLEKELLENERSEVLQSAKEEAAQIIKNARTQSLELLRKLEGAALSAAHRVFSEEKDLLMTSHEMTSGKQKKKLKTTKSTKTPDQLAEGMIVQIDNGKNTGTVLSIEGEKANVQVGQIRMEIPKERLRVVKTPSEKVHDRPVHSTRLERPVNVSSSLMIRGMTVDESMPLVERYLDQAMRAGYDSVLIIHGRGQGVLRKEVHSICSRLPYIREFRLGNAGEGGHGVTVVTFRK